jgi:hypothetical protein
MNNFQKAYIPNSPNVFCPIPKWVYQTLVKNKINVMEFRNYGKVRSVLSLNDLRDWALADAAFDTLRITYKQDYLFGWTSGREFTAHFPILTDEQRKELEYSVKPLVGTEENIAYIKNRLIVAEDVMPSLETSAYKFVNDVDVIYLVIDEGIINTLQTKKGAFDFSKKCLEQFYSMMSMADASNLGIYSVYLKELQGSVL